MRNFGDHLILYDKSNTAKPLTFNIRLRYTWWGEDRLVITDPLQSEKVLYKIICQAKDFCRILGWTKDRTNVTTLASLNTMAWYPYPTRDDPKFYDHEERNKTGDILKSKVLLKQPLVISTKLFDNMFDVTFFSTEKKYKVAYNKHHVRAEITNFDRSTLQHHHNDDYFLYVSEDINPKIDPAFLVSICIMIDYIEWPYYLSRN